MNIKLSGYLYIRNNHHELWAQLRDLSKMENLCSYGFRYGKTLAEVERKMDAIEWENKHQLKLF